MSSGINFGGLSSGLDTEGIIARLVSIQRAPIQRLQVQQRQLEQRAELMVGLKNQISSVAQSANSLLTADAFTPVLPTVSDTAVASLTMNGIGQPGSYNLSVSRLATAQKVSSTGQASASAALGTTGKFTVNGKLVNLDETDSLASISRKINDLSAGVTASIIDGGTGNAFLTLTASQTGINNKIQLSDLTGNFLTSMGLTTGSSSLRVPITNGAAGISFSNSSQSIGSLLGASGLGSETIQINGTDIAIDLQTDSLQAIADKINLSSSGATASVVGVTEGSNTRYRLEIKGSSTPTFTDSGNVLKVLGILQPEAGNQLVAAQDAAYTIDGVSLTATTNTIEGVIPGAKLTLLKADQTTPPTTTITLASDTDAIANRIDGFTKSYNGALAFIEQNSQFNADTFETGALFGDSTARQFISTVNNLILASNPGLTGNFKSLTDIGIRLGSDGNLSVDRTRLVNAINTDADGVRKLFQNFGTSSSSNVQYISSTSSTQPSTPSTYEVNITQIATKTRYISATEKTGINTTSEKLTFSGNLLGATNYEITIDVGSDLQRIIDRINGDVKLKDLVVASNNGGKLQVDSKRFGSNGLFNLVSNQSPSSTNSGVGFTAGSLINGLDVQGTLNGEAATGVGQFLTGASTNTKANGLQIQYTGTSTGLQGNVNFTRGMSGTINQALNIFTDFANGLTVTGEKSVRDQIKSIEEDINRINARGNEMTTELRNKFATMEERIAKIQSQGSRIASLNQTATQAR